MTNCNCPRAASLEITVAAQAGPEAADDDVPERIIRCDIATREDLLFGHMLAPLLGGEVGDWPIMAGLGKQLGTRVEQFVDARQVAGLMAEAFPVEGQPALGPLERVVADCAARLGVPAPAVHVRNSPFTHAYVVRASGRDHLVVTSGLLNLYAGTPAELKFVVGHELGHVECGHVDLRQKAFGLLSAVQAISLAVVPDRYQAVLPTLAPGRLYAWCRESEVSADRAGLLCCEDPRAAYGAIMRLQHGLNRDSPRIDPEAPGFDPGAVVAGFRRWQAEPFVRLILDLKRHAMVQPFVPGRLAALKTWVDSGAHTAILARPEPAGAGNLIEVVEIRAFEPAAEGESVDPYAPVFDGDERVLRTSTAAGLRAARWRGFRSTDRGVRQPRPWQDDRPLFFEVWDDNTLSDTFVGGFVVYPDARDAAEDEHGDRFAEYTARILWDWKETRAITRPGYARVGVKFLGRSGSQNGPGTRKAGP